MQTGVQLPFGYAGEQQDAESGLVYLRARYLDPATGRFLTRDSLGGLPTLPQSQHPYLYAHADPADLTDPSGHSPLGGGGAGTGGGAGGLACGGADDLVNLLLSDPRDLTTTSQVHAVLGLAGLVPGLGTAASLADAALYLSAGDYTNAALAALGAVPLAGVAAHVALAAKAGLLAKGGLALKEGILSGKLAVVVGGIREVDGGVQEAIRLEVGTGRAYSVAYRMKLPASAYPGQSRSQHFKLANQSLLADLDADQQFASGMEQLIPRIRQDLVGPRGGIRDWSPYRWTWHHAPEDGVLELVPRIQHAAPGPLQRLLHPEGKGGFERWG